MSNFYTFTHKVVRSTPYVIAHWVNLPDPSIKHRAHGTSSSSVMTVMTVRLKARIEFSHVSSSFRRSFVCEYLEKD